MTAIISRYYREKRYAIRHQYREKGHREIISRYMTTSKCGISHLFTRTPREIMEMNFLSKIDRDKLRLWKTLWGAENVLNHLLIYSRVSEFYETKRVQVRRISSREEQTIQTCVRNQWIRCEKYPFYSEIRLLDRDFDFLEVVEVGTNDFKNFEVRSLRGDSNSSVDIFSIPDLANPSW